MKLTPDQVLLDAHPEQTIALGGAALVLPRPWVYLDLFVYNRSSRFMNYQRQKQELAEGSGYHPRCCLLA